MRAVGAVFVGWLVLILGGLTYLLVLALLQR